MDALDLLELGGSNQKMVGKDLFIFFNLENQEVVNFILNS